MIIPVRKRVTIGKFWFIIGRNAKSVPVVLAFGLAAAVLGAYVVAPQPSSVKADAQAGDANSDRRTDAVDLSLVLTQYGASGSADFNKNGAVDITDLSVVISGYGSQR